MGVWTWVGAQACWLHAELLTSVAEQNRKRCSQSSLMTVFLWSGRVKFFLMMGVRDQMHCCVIIALNH